MKTDLVVSAYILHKDKVLLVHHRKLGLWLPVGGHINPNETPDDAMLREAKEETNLDIEFLEPSTFQAKAAVIKVLANPFHTNVHLAGDHHHCCFFYACRALNPESLKINPELKGAKWFSKVELLNGSIPEDVKEHALCVLGKFS